MDIVLDDRAMVVKFREASILVIADLHLGFEKDLEERGVRVPSQHNRILERVESLANKYRISVLYVLGDVKHSIFPDFSYNWETIPEFMGALADLTETIIIPGNHDGDLDAFLPRSVRLVEHSGVLLENNMERLGMLHGHSWPSSNVLEADLIVTGHNHPVIRRLSDVSSQDLGRGRRIRYGRTLPVVIKSALDRSCVRKHLSISEGSQDSSATLVTLPTFNELFRGVAVNSPESDFYGPFYENKCASLVKSDVFSTGGIFLGKVSWLREQFNEMIKSRPEPR